MLILPIVMIHPTRHVHTLCHLYAPFVIHSALKVDKQIWVCLIRKKKKGKNLNVLFKL